MSTRSAESRDNSPDGSPEKRVSKKRKVLSCYACRSRKMRCDRIYPICSRCQKTGRADQCTYDPRLLEDLPANGDGHADGTSMFAGQSDNAASAPVSSDVVTWKLRVQERRLEMMEKRLASLDNDKNPSFSGPPSQFDDFQSGEPDLGEEMMFRGKSFKTQFYGSTSPLSVLTQFSELQAFTREALIFDGNMARIRNDFKTFRNRRKEMLKQKSLKTLGHDEEIYALVPEKNVVDPLVALYFHSWETSYRILHEPTFWKDYQSFWGRRSNEGWANFAAILVYIVIITKCLKPNEDNYFIGDSSADRDSALHLVETCDTWLSRQSRKHLTLPFFQLQCLSLLAKRVNCLKLKQDWITSGDVVRLAIASGMHRNPALLAGGRVNEFDKEMRRRLWVTIVELELQPSVDCGLQSSVCGLHFDIQAPANLPDDAFSPDSTQIPASRPIEHFTSASYLNVTLKSLPLRLHLLQLLNNPTTDLHYSDVLHYDAQITSLLSLLPAWDDPRAIVPTALLELQLRQFLLILHRPYAKLAAKNQRFSYSFTACVDTSSTMLSTFENLISKGTLGLNHIRNDVLRAAITLAQTVYHVCLPTSPSRNQNPATASQSDSTNLHAIDVPALAMQKPLPPAPELKIPQLPTNNFLTTTLCTTAVTLLEKARQLFEHKVMRLGTGYIEYWLICSAQGIMPMTTTSQPATSIASITNSTPDDLRSRGRKALERVTSLCFRVLALQRDQENNFASSLRTSITIPSPTTPMSNVVPPGTTPLTTGTDNTIPIIIPGASGMVSALSDGKDMGEGAFDGLEDMNVDLSGWAFPDFWQFDMAGDY